MMKKRILALLLCGAMALSLLTGCGGKESELTDEQILEAVREDEIDYLTDGKLDADTVVMTVGGQEITAQRYLYWLSYYLADVNRYYTSYQQTFDLTSEVSDGVTMTQYLENMAQDAVTSYTAVEQQAAEQDVTLSAEAEANASTYADLQNEDMMLYYCTTADEQADIYRQYQFGSALRQKLYGPGGELAPTDETLEDFIADNGVYTCRYILCSVEDGEDEEEVARQREACQAIYDELSKLKGEAQLKRFIELQGQNADGNTDEYTFDSDDSLVDGFRETVAELKSGEIDMTDLTGYGFFTILRLDVDPDAVEEDYISSNFSAKMDEWTGAAEVTREKVLDKFDTQAFCEKVLKVQELLAAEIAAAQQDAADSSVAATDPADGSAGGTDPADASAVGTDPADGSAATTDPADGSIS